MSESWLQLLFRVQSEVAQYKECEREEDVARLNLLVEERSCLAHLTRKLRTAALSLRRGGTVPESSDSDEEKPSRVGGASAFPSSSAAAAPVEPLPPLRPFAVKPRDNSIGSNKMLKWRMLAEHRQQEWGFFEEKSRELRRQYEETQDGAILDQLELLQNPLKKQTAKRQRVRERFEAAKKLEDEHCVTTPTKCTADGEKEAVTETQGTNASAPPDDSAAAADSEIQKEVSPEELATRQAYREEGFARATLLMEEHSVRVALRKQWAISLVEGDEDMRIRMWDREYHEREVALRAEVREENARQQQSRSAHSMAEKHRAIAAAQNQRMITKRMFRDARNKLCENEAERRASIVQEWVTWFDISIMTMHFKDILASVPMEEACHRGAILNKQRWIFEKIFVRYLRYLRTTELFLNNSVPNSFQQLYDETSADIQRDIELFHKQEAEEEAQRKRRDATREVEDAKERERMMLELKYGASPLTMRPGSGPHRLKLRPEEQLEVTIATHPMSGIWEAIQRVSRLNKEGNALFMAMERRYVNVKKKEDANEPPVKQQQQQEHDQQHSEESGDKNERRSHPAVTMAEEAR